MLQKSKMIYFELYLLSWCRERVAAARVARVAIAAVAGRVGKSAARSKNADW